MMKRMKEELRMYDINLDEYKFISSSNMNGEIEISFKKLDFKGEMKVFVTERDGQLQLEGVKMHVYSSDEFKENLDKNVEYFYQVPYKVVHRIGGENMKKIAESDYSLEVTEEQRKTLSQGDKEARREALAEILAASGYNDAAENIRRQESWKKVRETVNFFTEKLLTA